MDNQDLLAAVETIVKTQIAENNNILEAKISEKIAEKIADNNIILEAKISEKITDNNIILEAKMKQMADNAATNAAGIVMEQMQSQFKVFGEALQTIIENTSSHESRITRVENQVAVHELAIKRHFR